MHPLLAAVLASCSLPHECHTLQTHLLHQQHTMPTPPSHEMHLHLKHTSKTAPPRRSTLHRTTVDHLLGDAEYSVYTRITSHLSSPNPSLSPSPKVNLIFSKLVDLLHRGPHSAAPIIAESPLLLARAHAIATAANDAEYELERHYAALLLNAPLTHAVYSASLSSEARMKAVLGAARPFPYVGNYERLVRAECAVLKACFCDAQSVAVVGAGPLPLSGVLMAAQLDVSVTLIDVDEKATALAAALVDRWEAAGVIPRNRVRAQCADARDVCFARGPVSGTVRADLVLVCSLVPDDAKVTLMRRLSSSEWDGVVGVRSAHGLTALANYERTDRHLLSGLLDFVGYVAPVACLEGGVAVGEVERPIAVFPRDVLNSIEIYTVRTNAQQVACRMREEVVRRFGQDILDSPSVP